MQKKREKRREEKVERRNKSTTHEESKEEYKDKDACGGTIELTHRDGGHGGDLLDSIYTRDKKRQRVVE